MIIKKLLLAVIAAGAFLTTSVTAQTWGSATVRTEKVAGGVYVLFGEGGNVGVLVGADGVLIVDDLFAPLAGKIKTAIEALSDKPIRFAINTHFHDHSTGGNESLGKTGTVIIAHENVRIRMAAGTLISEAKFRTDPQAGPALPVIAYKNQTVLHMNGEKVRIHYVHNAHTDGDSIVHFEGSNVIHMGGTFYVGTFPFIDLDNGGSLDGLIAAANKVLSMADADTRIIPSHGSVTDKEGLKLYRDMLVDVREKVSVLKSLGWGLEDVQGSFVLDDHLPYFGQSSESGANWARSFIGTVFNSIW
ncbi:MAG: MBL fold metallo-hydrolase [Kordiimonadaceae bacterium]|nr:MBL fold metallo-hydrolase [Kordiimonadaceae bacterium]MBO6568411.1 MBL fold metallo-hydrolase [Kordiimonadaceae bacterium]MBO6963860.1 MBL fold metallo-hydrolase [Kordiimonadaceae bacterium]